VARIDRDGGEARSEGPTMHLRGSGREPEVRGDGEGLRHAAQPLARLRLRGSHRLAGRLVRPQAELVTLEPRRLQMPAAWAALL
jgi:hypothetical protein